MYIINFYTFDSNIIKGIIQLGGIYMKWNIKKSLAVALATVMTMTATTAVLPAQNLNLISSSSALKNVSYNGEDMISLVEPRSFKVELSIASEVDPATVEWTLHRNDSIQYGNPELYPAQFQGGALDSIKCYKGSETDFIQNVQTEVKTILDKTYVTLTFDTVNYFNGDYSVPHENGGAYLDVCGYFDLVATSGESQIASTMIKISPYDQFNTMNDIYNQLDEMVAEASSMSNLYVEKFSMGTSTAGYDMPYLILSDKSSSVDYWMDYVDFAIDSPTAALEAIAAGKYNDIRIPILVNNIHSNETSGVDGMMTFTWKIIEAMKNGTPTMTYKMLTGFTAEGEAQLQEDIAKNNLAVPDLVADSATYLGYIYADNFNPENGVHYSGVVDLEKYYTVETLTVNIADLLSDVFFIISPEQNVDGRTYLTRTGSVGFDLNRDNSFQISAETQNMQQLIGQFNPIALSEIHGRVRSFQCEPCDPPHEPNFEYDLLAEYLLPAGEAFGIAAVANNDGYNSYVIPQRDYLEYLEDGTTYWADPWDDMSTSYTPQFAMLHGTLGYTVELPAYSDTTADATVYGILGQANYIASEKMGMLTNQAKIWERGATNANSNAYELVGQWFADQYDVEGAESDLFRPIYDGEGENQNFYPECYIIPMDGENQTNIANAYEMMEWLSRNDVKIKLTEKEITIDSVTYPKGTMIISMYQAKRSVANGALYDGTLINNWTVLYSEGITTFNETRGFDMATVAKPADFAVIDAACGAFMDYEASLNHLSTLTSSFSGVTTGDVVISNVSENSTAAVNALLKNDKKVGMVTDENSAYYGDFVCSYADWLTVKDTYVLTGYGVGTNTPYANVINQAPTVYVSGQPSTNTTGGYIKTTFTAASYQWNYDRVAMEMMNFDMVSDPSEANIVLGSAKLDEAGLEEVQNGKPYIGYGVYATTGYAELFSEDMMELSRAEGMDCLGYVTYPNTSLVNASYVMDGDDILYGYGLGYFSKVPEGATVLVQMDGTKTPSEGFIKAISDEQKTKMNTYLNNSYQAFSYEGDDKNGNDIDVTLFASSLTHKVHQQDEFAFISNFIFSKLLSDTKY